MQKNIARLAWLGRKLFSTRSIDIEPISMQNRGLRQVYLSYGLMPYDFEIYLRRLADSTPQ